MTPRAFGPALRVEGVPRRTRRDGRVAAHRDCWDLLESMMETVPLAGTVYEAAVALRGVSAQPP